MGSPAHGNSDGRIDRSHALPLAAQAQIEQIGNWPSLTRSDKRHKRHWPSGSW
ncbi:hypothetical protein D9M73_133950 [compost metagenome]|jgi:hypothetical protein